MRIAPITSLDEPALADYARLTDVALRRVTEPEGGLYIAESLTVIERALRAGHKPRSVLTSERWLPELEALLEEREVGHSILRLAELGADRAIHPHLAADEEAVRIVERARQLNEITDCP